MKMLACAVIAEFNPFHNGHAYLLQKARQKTGADILIVVMSGNFVQRGEPALINKWERARLALMNGADLVVEIPTEYATDSAREFAHAGVTIANEMQSDYLAFGSETPNLDFEKESRIIDRLFNEQLSYNQNFASQLFHGTDIVNSNDILGINYTYWNAQSSKSKMQLLPIQRIGANHLDSNVGGDIASASSIRKSFLKNDQEYQSAVPTATKEVLAATKPVIWDDYWELLKYKILISSPESLSHVKNMNEGFEYRVLSMLDGSDSFLTLMKNLKTKRYTYTSIQRKMLNILLDIHNERFQLSKSRLLATNSLGRRYIKEKKLKNFLMTKVSKVDFATNYKITKRADEIYQLVSPYNWGKSPIITDDVKE